MCKANVEPAYSIIRKLGGDARVAEICGLEDRTTPYRWRQPKAKRGSGGVIPSRHLPVLLKYARTKRIPLKAADFVPGESAE